jgi:hypothetical protein
MAEPVSKYRGLHNDNHKNTYAIVELWLILSKVAILVRVFLEPRHTNTALKGIVS